ncbi:MAG: hypothetical protein ACRCXB_31380 [Aeromonadaceae bacterium]
MKISKSKQELARIISENGGWRDGAANWAAMNGLRNATYNVAAYGEIPVYEKVKKWHKPSDFTAYHEDWFQVSTAIKNFHQTTLSRAEYFHLYPEPDADGWIEWSGGECPVDAGAMVVCKVRTGKLWRNGKAIAAGVLRWSDTDSTTDIIAYRLHKQDQAKPEFCESVMRSIPEPSDNPTIEQLAADYRYAKDFAERKQKEADSAKGDADAKLAELVAAGKALSLVISVAEQEPELVITDYHQLYIGDILRCKSVPSGAKCRVGDEGVLKRTENSPLAGGVYVEVCDKDWFGVFGEHWEFIRRP